MWKNKTKKLKNAVCSILKEGFDKRENQAFGFTTFLTRFVEEYNLGIDQSKENTTYYVYGRLCLYHLWGDMVYYMKWLEAKGFIQYFTQIERTTDEEEKTKQTTNLQIGDCKDYTNKLKLDGDIKRYIEEHLPYNIWISPELKSYVKNGFMTDELYEAKQQTKKASWTLAVAVITILIQIAMQYYGHCL